MLLLGLLLGLLGAALGERPSTPCTGCGAALTSMLKDVSFGVSSVSVTEAGVIIEIDDVICDQFSIAEFEVDNSPSKVSFSAEDIGVVCNAKYRYHRDSFPKLHGEGTIFAKTTNSNASMHIQYQFDSVSVPVGLIAMQCDGKFNFKEIKFDGQQLLSYLLDLLVAIARPMLENTLKTELCQKLTGLINVNGTQLLQEGALHVHQFLSANPVLDIPPAVPADEPMVRFSDLKRYLNTFHSYVTPPSAATDVEELPINKAMNSLTQGTGRYVVNLGRKEVAMEMMNLTLLDLAFEGLNSFQNFDILKNVEISGYPGDYSLQFDISLKSLETKFEGIISLPPDSFFFENKHALTSDVSLSLGIQDLDVRIVMQLLISKEELENFRIFQIFHCTFDCATNLVKGVSISLANVTVSSYKVPEVSGFDGFAPLVNRALLILNDLYSRVSLPLIHGAIGTTLKRNLNAGLSSIFHV